MNAFILFLHIPSEDKIRKTIIMPTGKLVSGPCKESCMSLDIKSLGPE